MDSKKYVVYAHPCNEKDHNGAYQRNYVRTDYEKRCCDKEYDCDKDCYNDCFEDRHCCEDRWEEERCCHERFEKDQPKKKYEDKYNTDEPKCEDRKGRKENHYDEDGHCEKGKCEEYECEQTHVHEFEGSTKLAEECSERHNHRFAGVSGEIVKIPGGHVHKVYTRTDFFDHFHTICRLTCPAIYVECEEEDDHNKSCNWKEKKHVHFVKGMTTCEDGHKHEFQFATLIESPLLPQPKLQHRPM